ncbi:MAG: exopolysaccharide biosynthesis protein [Actinomycetes bacterium]
MTGAQSESRSAEGKLPDEQGTGSGEVDRREVEPPFSDRLEGWLKSEGPKTLGGLDHVFAEKSFAVAILLLMFLPALPLPTGGLSHAFSAIAMLIALQMVIGANSIWLPEKWKHRELGEAITGKAIPLMAKRIRWFERFAKPRGAWLLDRKWFIRLMGLSLFGLALATWFAPPFSGLDTFPAMGAVVICLGLIVGDLLVVGIGAVIGVGGVTLIVTLGAAAVQVVKGIFN